MSVHNLASFCTDLRYLVSFYRKSSIFTGSTLSHTDVQRASWESTVNTETPVRRTAAGMEGRAWRRPCWGKPRASVPRGSPARTASTPPRTPATRRPPVGTEARAACSARMTTSAPAKSASQVSHGTQLSFSGAQRAPLCSILETLTASSSGSPSFGAQGLPVWFQTLKFSFLLSFQRGEREKGSDTQVSGGLPYTSQDRRPGSPRCYRESSRPAASG